jgi:hypothetical protein
MLASVDALAADAELVVELSPSWWSDPRLVRRGQPAEPDMQSVVVGEDVAGVGRRE